MEKLKAVFRILLSDQYVVFSTRKNKATSAFISDNAQSIFINCVIETLKIINNKVDDK